MLARRAELAAKLAAEREQAQQRVAQERLANPWSGISLINTSCLSTESYLPLHRSCKWDSMVTEAQQEGSATASEVISLLRRALAEDPHLLSGPGWDGEDEEADMETESPRNSFDSDQLLLLSSITWGSGSNCRKDDGQIKPHSCCIL